MPQFGMDYHPIKWFPAKRIVQQPKGFFSEARVKFHMNIGLYPRYDHQKQRQWQDDPAQ
jgi:hypothetical protein